MTYVQSYSTSGNGFVWAPATSEKCDTQKGLLVTRAIETKDGWVGQIIVDKTIVWQSNPVEDQDDAVKDATDRVVARLKKLFV